LLTCVIVRYNVSTPHRELSLSTSTTNRNLVQIIAIRWYLRDAVVIRSVT
jgi:hypothetical protein